MDDAWIALVSAGTSVVAAVVSGLLSVRALRGQGLANRVQAAGVRNQYFVELRRWADEACTCLSEASHLCDLDPAKTAGPGYFERRHDLRIRLSALIDRGRWFFPNVPAPGVGLNKPVAFQGYRHEVLDGLVDAYRLVIRLDHKHQASNSQAKAELEATRRFFVGAIQGVLDPRGLADEFARIMGSPVESKGTNVTRRAG